ncbi:MAG TPA: autotransporter domain-containing protein, partial [Ramlibacter sp.]|nr:autotransporter domain-containing protein [Ramlibacter sp.]
GTVVATTSSASATNSTSGLRSQTAGFGQAIVVLGAGTVSGNGRDADGITAVSTGGTYAVDVTGGTVTGGADAGAAIGTAAAGGGTIDIGAAAVVNAGASGIAIRDGDLNRDGTDETGGNASITTAGTVNGSIILGGGTDALTVTGGAINGNLAGDGVDALRFAAGSGSFAHGAAYAITGMDSVTMDSGTVQIGGALTANTLSVNGGTLSLAGATAMAGGTTVNGGILRVNGSLTGNASINNGGTLGGTGTTGNVMVNSGGTLAPGNSIGTLTVNGNLGFGVGSIFQVEADAAGNADRANATGTLSIGGGRVDVRAGGSGYARETRYTILSADGGRSGAFDTVTTDLAFLTPSLDYDGNNVYLVLQAGGGAMSYADAAVTRNQRNVAEYLSSFAAAPANAAAAALIQQVDNLSVQDARRAFDSLAGTPHTSASQVASALGRNFSASLAARSGFSVAGLAHAATDFMPLRYASIGTALQQPEVRSDVAQAGRARAPQPSPAQQHARGFWVQALGAGGRLGDDANGPDMDYRSNGLVFGYDQPVDGRWLAGAAVGYNRSRWDATIGGQDPGNGKLESAHGGLYARYQGSPWRVRFDLTYATHEFDTERTVTVGTSRSTAESNHRGGEWGVSAQVDHPLQWGSWELRPTAGLRHSRLRENAFDESGPGVGNLAVGRRTMESTLASAGVHFSRQFNAGKGALELRAVASHLFGDNDSPVVASIAAQPGVFTAYGSPLKRTAVTLGATVNGQFARNLTGYVDVNYEYRGSGQNAYQLGVGVRASF